jgi:periplasmic protein TonB
MNSNMRLVYFFVLSLALHAAALGYPVFFAEPSKGEVIRVTIAPMAPGTGGTTGHGGSGIPARQAVSKPRPGTAPAVEPKVDMQPVRVPERQALPIEPIEKTRDSNVALVSATASVKNYRNVMLGSDTDTFYGVGANASGTGGLDVTGAGSGRGSGNGNATDSSGNGIAVTQARYRDTPRPEYPETARREGREGSVLLRVLVDDQGRSQQVEINRSSGSDALDRAAVDAIKRWHFYPARYGDRAIESWIKIPIEFALANANRH